MCYNIVLRSTSMYTKFDGPSWKSSVCMVFTSSVDRPTDRRPDTYHDRLHQAYNKNTKRFKFQDLNICPSDIFHVDPDKEANARV